MKSKLFVTSVFTFFLFFAGSFFRDFFNFNRFSFNFDKFKSFGRFFFSFFPGSSFAEEK